MMIVTHTLRLKRITYNSENKISIKSAIDQILDMTSKGMLRKTKYFLKLSANL